MKERIKRAIADIVYAGYRFMDKYDADGIIHVMSIEDTIRQIQDKKLSMIRFGDGEILLIRGKSLSFQDCTSQLSSELLRSLRANEEGLLVAIPDIFNGLNQYVPSTQQFWKDHLLFSRSIYYRNCDRHRTYGNAFISRCYLEQQDRSKCSDWFDSIMKLWANEKVTVIEGVGSHTGVGNDMLNTATDVQRILCPARQAYKYYTNILEACNKIDKDRLILISLGPTAKPLGLELFHRGYRVLDIGNLDTEYEWYISGTTTKSKIAKQQIMTEEDNRNHGYDQYLAEVIGRVGC